MIKLKKKYSTFNYGNDNKELKIKCFRYYLEIYNIYVSIIIGDDLCDKYAKFVYRKPIYALTSDWSDLHNDVILFFNSKAIKDKSVIVHECVHACDYILVAIKYNKTNTADEINAYLTEHLFNVVLKAVKMKKRGKKRGKK